MWRGCQRGGRWCGSKELAEKRGLSPLLRVEFRLGLGMFGLAGGSGYGEGWRRMRLCGGAARARWSSGREEADSAGSRDCPTENSGLRSNAADEAHSNMCNRVRIMHSTTLDWWVKRRLRTAGELSVRSACGCLGLAAECPALSPSCPARQPLPPSITHYIA